MKFLSFFLFLFLAIGAYSQDDEIFMKENGKALDFYLKILEVKNDTIFYKAFRKVRRQSLSEVLKYRWNGVMHYTDASAVSTKKTDSISTTVKNELDTIEVKKVALGIVFRKKGKNLKPRELLEITYPNSQAYHEMKIAKTNFDFNNVFGVIGGFLVGWPLGTAIGGGKPNWSLAAVGAAFIGIEIPFAKAYNKHAKNAVRIYNDWVKAGRIKN